MQTALKLVQVMMMKVRKSVARLVMVERVLRVEKLAMERSVVVAAAVGVVVAGLVERGARAARPGATSLLAMRRVLRRHPFSRVRRVLRRRRRHPWSVRRGRRHRDLMAGVRLAGDLRVRRGLRRHRRLVKRGLRPRRQRVRSSQWL